MSKKITIDSVAESQVIDQPNRRTIYDASVNEIFWKSFVAGVGLGMGRMVATLIFFTIVLGIFVTYLEPWLVSFMNQIDSIVPSFLIPVTEQQDETPAQSRFQYSEQQIFDVFNSFRPAGSPEPIPTTTTDTTL